MEPVKRKKVLVTGATGFVGKHLAQRLVQDGFQVRVLVRPTIYLSDLKKPGVELVMGDVTSPVPLQQFVELIAQEVKAPLNLSPRVAWPFQVYHQMAGLVFNRLGFEIPFSHRYEFFFSDKVFDLSKAHQDLGFAPMVSVPEMIHQTAQWYREQGFLKPGQD